jgi:molybdate/tungstate transport system substrate-binding protein
VDVLIDAHGSIQCVRHVTELDGLADVVAVADYALIPMLMYETEDPEIGQPYATWTLQFATNRLGIAYTPQSAHAGEIGAENWYEILSRPDVLLGLSDPRFDACGYRGLMLAQLAGFHYGDQDIFADLFGSRFTQPLRVQTRGDVSTILVPEVLQPEKDSGLVMRGSSVRLLALLQSGDLDYAFEYESVARQHGLEFLPLPHTRTTMSASASASISSALPVSIQRLRGRPSLTASPYRPMPHTPTWLSSLSSSLSARRGRRLWRSTSIQ